MSEFHLSADLRRAVCVHEAGHAVLFALGGLYVWRVAVAPEGAKAWESTSRKGNLSVDLWGVCEPAAAHPAWMFMRWDDDECCLVTDRRGFRRHLAVLERERKGIRREALREVRAHLCATLAGPIAEQLHRNEEPEIDYEGQWNNLDDAKLAMAADALLPWRDELEAMHTLTVQMLRREDVWAMVLRLADELGRAGSIEDELDRFLPVQVPNWPPSPRVKKTPEFIIKPPRSVT